MSDFVELHGDRNFADDKSMVCGFARLDKYHVAVIGHQKGKDTQENIKRNFGMPHPEGYRKALRVMKLAEKFGKPIICFIDTMGAFPGIGAEERGQAEAIARNLREMSVIKVPIIIVIIGEGASGGALGIGVGDRVHMLENAWYCVISPEGCAAILWNDRAKAEDMAKVMKLSAFDLKELGIIDKIIPEPLGGAHRDYETTIDAVTKEILTALNELCKLPADELVDRRIEKYCSMGEYIEKT
jgi:acetyl-CoA carboxylase carboxyl transferase subunit alpha